MGNKISKNFVLKNQLSIKEDIDSINKQGIGAFRQGKYYEAITIWHKTIKIADSGKIIISIADYASILFNKARAYEKVGCLYLAQKGYHEVLKKDSHHVKAKEYLKSDEKLIENFKLETLRNNVKQFITLEGQSNNETKITILKEIEQIEYGALVRQFAYKKTAEEMKNLVIILKELGYLTTKLGELSGELKYYTEAAVFYQYVITILEVDKKLNNESENEFIKQQLTNSYQQLTDIQQLIFSAIGGDQAKMPIVQEEAKTNKYLLSVLRDKIDEEMQVVETYTQKANTDNREEKQLYQEFYVSAARALFEETANEMKKFLAKLYSNSEQQMAIPLPCKYTVVGLGSMALKQMTPYSDLEFAILTENEDYKQSDDPKIKEYFKNLSHLVNFKMINLGESIIPISKYKLDMSHLVHVAVNFDLGGKTPLGRIGGDKPYELIKTVEWMLHYVHNEKDKVSHIDKNLPYILENVCYVYGDTELVNHYQDKVTEFLQSENETQQGRLNCEIRAMKVLKEGTVEVDYLQQASSLKPKETPFKGDLKKLQPNLYAYDFRGRLFDVKQDIYRLPDRMVYNLGLYYGIEGDSGWDTVDKLEDQGIITAQAAFNLKNAITFATTLRLKTYSYHKAQKEDMSIFVRPVETESESKEQAKQIFHLSEEDLGEQGKLFQYFYTALPLHKKLEDLGNRYQTLDKASRKIFFKDSELYVDDFASKGFIYYRLAQYKKAQSNLEKTLNNPNYQDNLEIRLTLGNIYFDFGEGDKAIEQFEYRLDICKLIYGKEAHRDVAVSLNNLGNAYYAKGQYDLAIKYYDDSLKIRKVIYGKKPDLDVADSLNSLGSAYAVKGQYDQAINYFEESLMMGKLIYQDEPHPSVAHSFNNLGLAYSEKGQYDKAIKHLEESLKMYKLIYQDEPHPNVANSLNSLGNTYYNKGEYDQAIKYHEKSLKTKKLIYQDEMHPSVADSLNNLGNAYHAKGQYDRDIKYHEKSLKMKKLIYQDEPHPSVAHSFNNLGNAYYAKGQYDQAINYYEESLKMYKLIHQDELHPHIAMALNNLGNIYQAKENYKQTINYSSQALKMIFSFKDHPYTDGIKNNLIKIAVLFAKKYSLNPQKIAIKMFSFALQGLDFTDYKLHFTLALLQDDNNESDQHVAEMIGEYQLALIYLPKEQSAIKLEIYNKLAELTGEDHKNIELWLAIAEWDTGKIQELIRTGVDFDHVSSFMNTTPLIQAVVKGNFNMVSTIISGGADINKSNHDQASPLYCSLGLHGQAVNMNIVELLLASGASISKPVYNGDTPMHMAHYSGHKEAIGLLQKYGANINVQNAEGKTPLHCLLESKNVSTETKLTIIREFCQVYDMTIKDKDNKTVIDCVQEHYPELLLLLPNNFEVVDSIDLPTTNHGTNPNTSTNGNIDIDVSLLGNDSSATNQDLSPSP